MEWNRPEDWNDDERCSFLFSPLPRCRTDKPMHWDTKLSFWSDLILSSCRDLQQASIVGSELESRFLRKGLRPSSLDRVAAEMSRQGTLQRLDDWVKRYENPQSWLSWGTSLAWKPVSWAVTSVLGDGESEALKGVHVMPRLVEEFSGKVLSLWQSKEKDHRSTSAMSARAFSLLCKQALPYISDSDVRLIQLWLRKGIKLTVREESGANMKVFKLVKQGESKASPVTDVDVGILRLRNTASLLSQQITELLTDIDKLREKALERQKRGLKDSALAVLRQRRHLVKCLLKKESTADNIEQLLERIESADSEKRVLEAYQAGVSALQQTLSDPRLKPENIDATLDSLQQVLEDQAEVSEALSAGAGSLPFGDDVDVSELEDELAALTVQDGSSQPTAHTTNAKPMATPSLPPAQTREMPASKTTKDSRPTKQPALAS